MNPDRIQFAPINTGLYTNGIPDQKNIEFYAARSGKKIGKVLVGNISVDSSLTPNTKTGTLCKNERWSDLAFAIKEQGSAPGIQLAATCPGYVGLRTTPAKNHAAAIEAYKEICSNISSIQWVSMAKNFHTALHLAYRHGYDHMQIHAAHGYLWSLALDPLICPTKKPITLLAEILNDALTIGFSTVSLRISWTTGCCHDEERQAQILEFWDPFTESIDLDVSNGYYNADKSLIYPDLNSGETPWMPVAKDLSSSRPHSKFVFTGNVWNPLDTLTHLPENISIGIGRPVIADPDFLTSIKNGIKKCTLCGQCHYFSKGMSSLSCANLNVSAEK